MTAFAVSRRAERDIFDAKASELCSSRHRESPPSANLPHYKGYRQDQQASAQHRDLSTIHSAAYNKQLHCPNFTLPNQRPSYLLHNTTHGCSNNAPLCRPRPRPARPAQSPRSLGRSRDRTPPAEGVREKDS